MNEKERIAALLEQKRHVLFAYLFGSRVKAYATESSDWDVAVFLDPSAKLGGWPLFELEAEISREIRGNVQITALNEPLPPLLGIEILREGEALVIKDEGKHLEVTSHLLGQYLDWTYYQKRHMLASGMIEGRKD